MAQLPQMQFAWDMIEPLGDLARLQLVLSALPDEDLMRALEQQRGQGRNEYPVRAVWNSILAGIVFQHPTIESLRRELARNGQLRALCGLPVGVVPPAWAYTRFLHRLMDQAPLLDAMFDTLVERLGTLLPHFGERLAMDSKAIGSFAKHRNDQQTPDGRRDLDADYGKKTYHGEHPDGKPWQKIVVWFGYKLHLLVDATYELPVAWSVTKASTADITMAPEVLEEFAKRHPLALKPTFRKSGNAKSPISCGRYPDGSQTNPRSTGTPSASKILR